MRSHLFFFQTPGPMASPREFEADLVWQTFAGLWNGFVGHLPYLTIGIIVFLVFLLIARLARMIVVAAGHRTRLDVGLAVLLGRLASFVIALFGLFVAAVVIFPTFRPGDLIAGLGITSVAIGFAFKDVLQNFFAGMLILWRRPFVVGDQISFGEFAGTVEEITVRSTRIKTFDGERAVIPNGEIYTNAVLVKTAYDARRIRLNVGISYSEPIDKARETIYRTIAEIKDVLRYPEPAVYVSELASSTVNFTIYFWVNALQSDVTRLTDVVATRVKLALDDAGIEIPFPHYVVQLKDLR